MTPMTFHRRLGATVVILLLIGTAAHAQGGGGGRGGGGGGRGGGGGGGRGAPPSSSDGGPPPPPNVRQVAANQIDIVGVVKAIGPDDRITIDYEEAPALDLPAGSRSFVVAKTSLLKDVTVGERVRFRLDSQQVSVLAPFDGDSSQLSDGATDKGAGGRSGRSGSGSGL
jgi:Copper binding periplasmic protein CusF